MRPVCRLLFRCGIPPGIIQDDHVRAGQVQAGAAGLQADQEDLPFPFIEAVYQGQTLSGRRIPVQVKGGESVVFQPGLQQLQHAGKLAEEQDPPAAPDHFRHQLQQQLFLAASAPVIGHHQRRMTADFPQFRNGAQHLDASPSGSLFLQQLVDLGPQTFQGRPVDLLLFRGHPCRQGGLRLIRQFLQHVLLQPADQERLDPAQQVFRILAVLVLPEEGVVSRQITGQHKVKDAPELTYSVFHRRTGQGKAGFRLQLFHCLRCHAACVLDILCLIQDHETERIILQQGNIPPDQWIAGDHHVHIAVLRDMPNQACPLRSVTAQHRHAQIRRELPELAQPVIGQGGGCYHQAGPSGFPGRQHQRNDLGGFTQAHLIRQDTAHMHLVQPGHPFVAALLVIPQAQTRCHLRRFGFSAAVRQGFGQGLDLLVHFDFDAAVFQHAGQVSRTVGPEHNRIPVQLVAIPHRGLIDARGCLLPVGQVIQIQELTGPETEVPPFPAQSFHQLQDFIHRLAVPGQQQFQPVAVHPDTAGQDRPPGYNPFEITAEENLADFLQALNSLANKIKDRVRSAQADVLPADPETGIGQDIQYPVLPFRIPEQQLFSLVQGDLLLFHAKGIQCNLPVGEPDGGNHALPVLIQVNFALQRQADQPLAQFLPDFHRAADLQIREHFADDPLRILQRVFHQAASLILVFIDQPDQPGLFPFRPDQVSAGHHPGAVSRHRLQIRRDFSAHLQPPGTQVHREMHRHLNAPQRFAMDDLAALVHDTQHRIPVQLQHFLRKRIRQPHQPVGSRIGGPGARFLDGAQFPQDVQHPHIVICVPHPLRLIGKILAQWQDFVFIRRGQETADIFDYVELFLPGPQADPQFLSGFLGKHKGHFQPDVRLGRHLPQDHIGKLSRRIRCLLLHHAFRHLAAVRVKPYRHRMPAASLMQENVTVAVNHQAPGQRHGMQALVRHGIADHSLIFFRCLYRADFLQVPSSRVFLRPRQLLHQQRIQSHALLPACNNIELIIIRLQSSFFLSENSFV